MAEFTNSDEFTNSELMACVLARELNDGEIVRVGVATPVAEAAVRMAHLSYGPNIELVFFGGRMKGMPPKLVSDDGRHVVIRPLAYVPERLIARYATARAFPIIPCTLCGSQPNMQRMAVKNMLAGFLLATATAPVLPNAWMITQLMKA